MNTTDKTNPYLITLIDDLKQMSRVEDVAIWRDIAKRLEKSRRNWTEVNISRLERYADAGDSILVPGKVLGAGRLTKRLTVAAFDFSESAEKKIEEAGGQSLSIRELAQENPKGDNVRIMR